jgi:hypothetical protein
MFTAQGDFVCQENKDSTDTIENFAPPPISRIPPYGFNLTALPNGQYKKTCPDCVYYKKINGMGNILECNCEKTNFVTGAKELIYTKLNNCSKNQITNYGGNLICGW